MLYKKGEYFLIQDNNYKANKFIGEILDQKERNLYLLNVYIFPEDTKDGRQYYMSQYEVFLTSSEVLYSFDKKNEVKVEVTTIEEYISRKYISNEKVKYPLYFKRQIYCCEKIYLHLINYHLFVIVKKFLILINLLKNVYAT